MFRLFKKQVKAGPPTQSFAEKTNAIFVMNGLPTIPFDCRDWRPRLLANLEALSERSVNLHGSTKDKQDVSYE